MSDKWFLNFFADDYVINIINISLLVACRNGDREKKTHRRHTILNIFKLIHKIIMWLRFTMHKMNTCVTGDSFCLLHTCVYIFKFILPGCKTNGYKWKKKSNDTHITNSKRLVKRITWSMSKWIRPKSSVPPSNSIAIVTIHYLPKWLINGCQRRRCHGFTMIWIRFFLTKYFGSPSQNAFSAQYFLSHHENP